jgi:hypothetical protein
MTTDKCTNDATDSGGGGGGGCAAPVATHGVCGGRRCGDYLMCVHHRALDPLYQYRCECAAVLPHLRLPSTTAWFHIDRARAQALACVHDPLPRLCTWQLRAEPPPMAAVAEEE